MRIFISLDTNNIKPLVDLQNEIIKEMPNSSLLKPTLPENLHFTMLFIGEIEDETVVDKIKSQLNEIKFEPMNIIFHGLGVFPSLKLPRIIWVGVDKRNKEKMNKIFVELTDRLTKIGIKFDEKNSFTPHITIFRTKRIFEIEKIVNKYRDKTFGSDNIDKLSLKNSQLSSEGPKYSIIHQVNANQL